MLNNQTKIRSASFYILGALLLLTLSFNGGYYNSEQLLLAIPISIIGVLMLRLSTGHSLQISKLTVIGALIIGWAVIEWRTSPTLYISRGIIPLLLMYSVVGLTSQQLLHKHRTYMLIVIITIIGINALLSCGEEVLHKSIILTFHGIEAACVPTRYNGLLLNPNFSGGFSCAGLIMTLCWLGMTKRYKIIGGISSVVFIESILASQSRAALLISFFYLIILSIFLFSQKLRSGAIACLIAICIELVLCMSHQQLINRVAEIKKTKLDANIATGEGLRLAYWRGSFDLWKKEPIIGIHPMMLNSRWPEVQPKNHQSYPFHSHNFMLQILCEYGIIGGLLVCSFLLVCATGFLKCLREKKIIEIVAYSGALVLLTHDLLDYSLFEPLHGFTLLILLGLGSSTSFPETRFRNSTILLLSSTLVTMLAIQVQQAYTEHYAKINTIKSVNEALDWDPNNAALHLQLSRLFVDPQHMATEAFTALKLDPYNITAETELAVCLASTQRAISDNLIKGMLQKDPNSSIAYKQATFYYHTVGNHVAESNTLVILNSFPATSEGFQTH